MEKLDLSLDGILDNRWKLEQIGDNKLKLSYYSFKGLPTVQETKEAISRLLEYKKDLFMDTELYISGNNGDVKVDKENYQNKDISFATKKSIFNEPVGYDIYAGPFGAEEGLLYSSLERGN